MRYRNHILYICAIISVLLTPATLATESEQSLITSCHALVKEASTERVQLCELYIQGYIAGALTNDFANAEELASAELKKSEFTQRALRTRIGSRMDTSAPNLFLHFCLPEQLPPAIMIDKLRAHLTIDITTSEALNQMLLRVLRLEYPCENPIQ